MLANSPPVSISFLIDGLNNEYIFFLNARPRAHELMSQNGGELMS